MDRQQWLFTVVAIVVGAIIGTSLLGLLNRWLVLAGIVPLPRGLPSFLNNYEGDLVARRSSTRSSGGLCFRSSR